MNLQSIYPDPIRDRGYSAPATDKEVNDAPHTSGNEALCVFVLAGGAGALFHTWYALTVAYVTHTFAFCSESGAVSTTCQGTLLGISVAYITLFSLAGFLAYLILKRHLWLAFFFAGFFVELFVFFELALISSNPIASNFSWLYHHGSLWDYWLTPACLAGVAAIASYTLISRLNSKAIKIAWGAFIGVAVASLMLLPAWLTAVANKPVQPNRQLVQASSEAIDSVADAASRHKLDANVLQNIDKTDAFFGYLDNASQQQKLIITKGYFFTDSIKSMPDSDYTRTGFDYSTKSLVYAHDKINPDGVTRYKTRCVNGKEFHKDEFDKSARDQWTEDKFGGVVTDCSLLTLASNINDGFNTGGLTATQAGAFISALRERKGFITVKRMSLESHSDKQYLHFNVELTTSTNKAGFNSGIEWFMDSFKATGLNPNTYPYRYTGYASDGQQIDYYVDPLAKLPTYATIVNTTLKDDKVPSIAPHYYRFRVQYQFGNTAFDATPANDLPLDITW